MAHTWHRIAQKKLLHQNIAENRNSEQNWTKMQLILNKNEQKNPEQFWTITKLNKKATHLLHHHLPLYCGQEIVSWKLVENVPISMQACIDYFSTDSLNIKGLVKHIIIMDNTKHLATSKYVFCIFIALKCEVVTGSIPW